MTHPMVIIQFSWFLEDVSDSERVCVMTQEEDEERARIQRENFSTLWHGNPFAGAAAVSAPFRSHPLHPAEGGEE